MKTQNYDLKNLEDKNPKIKYGMQSKILKLAETNPQVLYQDFDYFEKLLNASNSIMIWTGLLVLGYLSKVDVDKKIDAILPKIIAKLNTGKMITAGNATKALTEICRNRPDLTDRIVKEIVQIDKYKYDTEECSHIAIGHALANLKLIYDSLSEDSKKLAIKFAKRSLNNPRCATAKKASYLLKKVGQK
jgi:hypothetical protein